MQKFVATTNITIINAIKSERESIKIMIIIIVYIYEIKIKPVNKKKQ